jgi:hypothetical protein
LEEPQVGLAPGDACQSAGEVRGRSVHSIRASGSSGTGLNEAAATAAYALDIARKNHDPAAEILALYAHEAAAACVGDGQLHLSGMRQAGDIDPAAVPGQIAPQVDFGLAVAVCEASELNAALRHGHRGLELARQAADETIKPTS